MYLKEDAGMMEKIFSLSDHALVRMVNQMFRKEYRTDADVIREWSRKEQMCIRLTVGCTDMYEYRLIHEPYCFQVRASECGRRYYAGKMPLCNVERVREPGFSYYGENVQEEGYAVREYWGKERISLATRTVTLADCSAMRLREMGMTLFLPFLFYPFLRKEWEEKDKQNALRYLLIYDIPETLNLCLREEDLTLYDVQRLKQFCKKMAWELLVMENWMENVEMQRLLMETLDTDLELLEKSYRKALLGTQIHKENTN